MKSITMILSLVLAALVVVVPTTYVLAHRATSDSYYGVTQSRVEDEEWWNEMRAYMEEHWKDHEDDAWWTEMKAYMADHWAHVQTEDGWNEMREHMEQRWTELEDGTYSYGSSSIYGGCGGMRW